MVRILADADNSENTWKDGYRAGLLENKASKDKRIRSLEKQLATQRARIDGLVDALTNALPVLQELDLPHLANQANAALAAAKGGAEMNPRNTQQVDAVYVLARILDDLEQAQQWVDGEMDAFDPELVQRQHHYLVQAQTLIELLETYQCGSTGGFDRGQEQRDRWCLVARFRWVLRRVYPMYPRGVWMPGARKRCVKLFTQCDAMWRKKWRRTGK